ncbi:hypothetical protein [Streptacidiphilus fuscans]|uniref:Uncharacterized protein n=1 Tax=Streptacidiphilus fuscans TaxID=2789292 RepID=A0A931B5T4_9ACTN|nr:hypothetical protein [Streptacidiphilus fuscans]MBF9071755.1 hypothetical protein [Streptacidiphilus fuscans]
MHPSDFLPPRQPGPGAQLGALATAIAQRLPGAWTSTHLDLDHHGIRIDVIERLLDHGIAEQALYDFVQRDGAHVLRGPSDQQLLLLRRPLAAHRRAPNVVSALVPSWAVELAHPPRTANGITVPADPARAARLIARRILPGYHDDLRRWEQLGTAAAWEQTPALHEDRTGRIWRRTALVAGAQHARPSARGTGRVQVRSH